jgi:hypothetical protein
MGRSHVRVKVAGGRLTAEPFKIPLRRLLYLYLQRPARIIIKP